jgi:hypothetical protein
MRLSIKSIAIGSVAVVQHVWGELNAELIMEMHVEHNYF